MLGFAWINEINLLGTRAACVGRTPTVILIIISIPSPTHSFIPGLKLPFLQILSTAAFNFLLQD